MRRRVMLWMGSEGASTWLHYDWSHNMHIMLRGEKKFVLFPERDLVTSLYLYPFLHPLATKSSVNISAPPDKRDAAHAGFESATPMEVRASARMYPHLTTNTP